MYLFERDNHRAKNLRVLCSLWEKTKQNRLNRSPWKIDLLILFQTMTQICSSREGGGGTKNPKGKYMHIPKIVGAPRGHTWGHNNKHELSCPSLKIHLFLYNWGPRHSSSPHSEQIPEISRDIVSGLPLSCLSRSSHQGWLLYCSRLTSGLEWWPDWENDLSRV